MNKAIEANVVNTSPAEAPTPTPGNATDTFIAENLNRRLDALIAEGITRHSELWSMVCAGWTNALMFLAATLSYESNGNYSKGELAQRLYLRATLKMQNVPETSPEYAKLSKLISDAMETGAFLAMSTYLGPQQDQSLPMTPASYRYQKQTQGVRNDCEVQVSYPNPVKW